MIYYHLMEKKYIISPYSMNDPTKNQLIRELLHDISIADLKILIDMKKDLHSKTKSERKPIPAPRKSVKQMTKEYEDNIIAPPIEYRDEKKPIPLPRTKIEETNKALKGYTSSYIISIKHNKDPLLQLQNTRLAVGHHIKKALSTMKGIKFNETLKVTFWKPQDDGWIYKSAYFNSKPQNVINDININEALQVTKQQILNFIAKWISEGSGWTIQSVDGHYINMIKYQPMKGSSYIQLPQVLRV